MSEILVVVAESSSALYAQRLLEHWRDQGEDVKAFGIGSQAMENLGFEILGRSEELAVVGIQEVLAHWSQIKETFDRLVDEAKKRKPRVALLLDYPDFNLRLAKKLKALGIPVVYYISPQVWAWRQSRIHKIKALVDHVLLLFPFEKEFYDKHQVPSTFVGHPLLDEVRDTHLDRQQIAEKRARYGLQASQKVLGLMPGSRRSEIKHHLKVQLEAAEVLQKRNPSLKVALLVAPSFNLEEVKQWIGDSGLSLILVKDEPFEMISMMDVVLCASGTATLMVGLMEKPMVIMYRMNPITAWIAKTFVRSTPYFGMINLILGKQVVPELFQESAEPDNLANTLETFFRDQELAERTRSELQKAKSLLGDKGATQRVAEALEGYIR